MKASLLKHSLDGECEIAIAGGQLIGRLPRRPKRFSHGV